MNKTGLIPQDCKSCGAGNDNRIELNTSEIKPGIYFCTLLSNGTIIGRKKLIISN